MKNKKLLICIIILVIIIIVGITGFIMYKNYNDSQIALLSKEAEKISSMDIMSEEIDKKIKTKGNYAVVEKTIKDYISEVYTVYNGITELCNNSKLSSILSAENIQADDTEFTSSKEIIANFRNELNDYADKCNILLDENNIISKIEEKNLNNKYVQLYKNMFLTENTAKELETAKNDLTSAVDTLNKTLDGLDKTLNFLKDNSEYWTISDGKIQFNNVKVLGEYYEIISDIQ